MKEKLAIGCMTSIGIIALGVAIGALMSVPTMWCVNSLFSPTTISSVFGAPQLTWEKAWLLNILCSFLFKSSTTKS